MASQHRYFRDHDGCTLTEECTICPLLELDGYSEVRVALNAGRKRSRRWLAECVHLGPDTGTRRTCPTCSGRVELKVFQCAVLGICTKGKAVAGVACCTNCPEYSPK